MISNNINIFEFPLNLGLKKSEYDVEPGVKYLPSWLKKDRFHNLIKPKQIFSLSAPNYSMHLDKESGVLNADEIIVYAKKQAEFLFNHMVQDSFQIILGGDCSILIGNAIALRQKGNYGLFFLDGHTDYVSPQMSQSRQAAAMELAIVTRYGNEKFTNILNLKPYFYEKNVYCVGNREYNSKVVNEISTSDINYFDLIALRIIGIKNCALKFLKMVADNQLDGFFIHLDVDVLNDDIMPAVDSREKDGLTYSEFSSLLSLLLASPKAIGIEITILDPNLDKDGKYTIEFISNFVNLICKSKN